MNFYKFISLFCWKGKKMKSKTEQIFSMIFQELKEEINKNKEKIFLKEYTIPSINYNPQSEDIDNMYFTSGIEMELDRMVSFFEYKIYYASYKDKYFFSNSQELAQEKMLKEIESESKIDGYEMDKTEELKQKLFTKLEQELTNFKQELKQKTADEIIKSAYELTVKEEIINEIKEKNLDKIEEMKERKIYIPRMIHPWKSKSFEEFIKTQKHRIENVA